MISRYVNGQELGMSAIVKTEKHQKRKSQVHNNRKVSKKWTRIKEKMSNSLTYH